MGIIISFLILLIWGICYKRSKKAIIVVPYIFMIFITPIYTLLDQNFFVDIFGCGCVPSAQTNMFNIPFNANDLRLLIYSIIIIVMGFLGVKYSKKFIDKNRKIVYILTIFITNLILGLKICQMYVWN